MNRTESNVLLQYLRKLVSAPAMHPLSDRELLQRFAEQRDETAFTTLVRRHGPMVLRLCQRLLQNGHDAEDAFQATFLVLASKAASRHWQPSVASWLHRVAYHLALKSKAAAARRAVHERQVVQRPTPDPLDTLTGRELLAVLDEELTRLPEKYRTPLVLCCLEGATRDQAALQLGCPLGTLKHRLEQGRALLRQRLVRRGLPLPAIFAAVLGTEEAVQAAVPLGLAQSAVQLAMQTALGKAMPAALVSSRAAALAEGVLKGMFLSKLKVGLAAVLAVCVAGAGASLAWQRVPAIKPAEEKQAGLRRPANQEAGGRPEPKAGQASLDRYGDPLPARALTRMGTVRFRHGGDVEQIAFSPDGKMLASASNIEGAIYLWEAATGRELNRLERATWMMNPGVAISPDGKLLVAGWNHALRRWELPAVKELSPFPVKTDAVGKPIFSPNGEIIACLGMGGQIENTIIFLDSASGRELHRFVGLDHYLAPSLAFSPDSAMWANANHKDKQIWLYDTKTGKEIRQLHGHPGPASTVAFSPDGKTLASSDFNGNLRFWEIATGELLPQTGHYSARLSLTYSPDGTFLAGDRFGLKPHLWEVATGQQLNRTQPRWYSCNGVAFSADGKMLACAIDQTIYLWDVAKEKAVQPLEGHRKRVGSLAFAPDGKTLATADGDWGITHFWEIATGKELSRPERVQDYVYAVAYSPDARFLAVGTSNHGGTIWLFDAATGKTIRKLTDQEFRVSSLAFSADGKVLASKFQRQTILWDTATGKELRRFSASYDSVSDAALSPDGKIVADADCAQGSIRLWDVSSGKELRVLVGHQPGCCAVAISPDGKLVASGSSKTVRLWDLEKGEEIHRMDGHQGSVLFVAFSPDGKTLASGGEDKAVRLWEVACGKQRGLLEGHRNLVRTGVFSADNKMLATGSYDTTALVWDLTGRLGDESEWGKPLSPAHLDDCWTALADDDAARAYEAVRKLAACPAQAIPYLGERLRPVSRADDKHVADLIADLDSNQFKVREKAATELEKLGELAVAACRRSLEGQPSADLRRRLEALIEKQSQEGRYPSPRSLQTLRALEVLELAGPQARQQLERLAGGAAEAHITQEAKASLERLARRPRTLPDNRSSK